VVAFPADEPKKLVIIPAADHFFEGRLREMRDVVENWTRETLEAAPV
jgi:alpha/beta superfamily hydrolase